MALKRTVESALAIFQLLYRFYVVVVVVVFGKFCTNYTMLSSLTKIQCPYLPTHGNNALVA